MLFLIAHKRVSERDEREWRPHWRWVFETLMWFTQLILLIHCSLPSTFEKSHSRSQIKWFWNVIHNTHQYTKYMMCTLYNTLDDTLNSNLSDGNSYLIFNTQRLFTPPFRMHANTVAYVQHTHICSTLLYKSFLWQRDNNTNGNY